MIESREGNWVQIKGWLNYEICDDGRVFSKRKNRMLKPWTDGETYPRLTLSHNTFYKTYHIHRLVAEHFCPNPENKLQVNHIDGNKQNFHYTNLEWCTQSENMIHAVTKGLAIPPKLPFGENHPASKLSEIDIAMIRVLTKYKFSFKQIADRFGVTEGHISLIKRRKTRTTTA